MVSRPKNIKKRSGPGWLNGEPLGKSLREAYEADKAAPIPENFRKLLDQIREEERRKNAKD